MGPTTGRRDLGARRAPLRLDRSRTRVLGTYHHPDRICAAQRLYLADAIGGAARGDRRCKGDLGADRLGPRPRALASNKASQRSDLTPSRPPDPASSGLGPQGAQVAPPRLGEGPQVDSPRTPSRPPAEVDGQRSTSSRGCATSATRKESAGAEHGGVRPLTDVESGRYESVEAGPYHTVPRPSRSHRRGPCWSCPPQRAKYPLAVLRGGLQEGQGPRVRRAEPARIRLRHAVVTYFKDIPRETGRLPARTPDFTRKFSACSGTTRRGPLLVLSSIQPPE